MSKFAKMTAAYSVVHYIVDFSCAFMIFSKVYGDEQWVLCLLLYNFCAFAMQLPFGILADKLNQNRRFAAIGCALVAASPLLAPLPVGLCIAAGLGNGLFHIGGGRDVLCGSGGKYSALGVFVAPGALGLFIGTLAGKTGVISAIIVSAVLLFCMVVILFFLPAYHDKKRMDYMPFSLKPSGGKIAIALLALFFVVVCLRSYVGMTLTFPWKSHGLWGFVLVLALVFGKMLGGVLADKFGDQRLASISLLASGVLFFFYKIPVCGVLAVLFFNMSMPITLGAAAKLLPGARGTSFGLLTFGLFIGFLPVALGAPRLLNLPLGYAIAALVSAILLSLGLKESNKCNLTSLEHS
ncbi:MAG: hypothetical protein RR394_00215 [Oscillospiraceae bacterium]